MGEQHKQEEEGGAKVIYEKKKGIAFCFRHKERCTDARIAPLVHYTKDRPSECSCRVSAWQQSPEAFRAQSRALLNRRFLAKKRE